MTCTGSDYLDTALPLLPPSGWHERAGDYANFSIGSD